MGKYFKKLKSMGKSIVAHPAVQDMIQQAKDTAKAAVISKVAGYKRGGRVRRTRRVRRVRRVRRRRG